MQIERVTPEPSAVVAVELADILIDCVEGGASVGFLTTVTREEALHFWQQTLAADATIPLVARSDGIVGVVQLKLAGQPNGVHRADVAKLLVRRSARGQGVAGALLTHLETAARESGRSLLVLDTETGSDAELLYLRLGWSRAGVIPCYAATPDGTLIATTVMYKQF